MIQVWRSEELVRNDPFDETVCQFSMRFTWSSGLSNVACTSGDLSRRISCSFVEAPSTWRIIG